jgi:hypothetical protein
MLATQLAGRDAFGAQREGVMSDNANRWTSGAFMRRLILLPVLVVAVSLAVTGAASAQTAFQADVKGAGSPVAGCSNGAFFCGTATIAGYGTASWSFYLTGLTPVQTSCGSTYTATTDFTLASDGSTLALDEGGYVCAPGKDGASFFGGGHSSVGNPNHTYGTWTVDTADSTGQFAGLGGSGTDALQDAGGQVSGNYTGTLGP